MKIHLSVYELWFWRIGIVVALVLSVTATIDNRKQDNLIFRTIDNVTETTDQITEIIGEIQILNESTDLNQKAIIKLLNN